MELNFNCKEVAISANNGRLVSITAEIEDNDKDVVLDHFEIADVIDYFDEDKILDHIGADAVKKYFGLIEIAEV